MTAPLLALYHTRPGLGLRLPVLEILMMLPPPFFFICGTVATTERYMLLTLTLNTRSNSFSVTSSVGLFLYVVPALLTTMSTRPHFCTQISIADFQCASFVTSMDWERISEEDEERVVASSLAPDSFRSPIKTLHPSWEKRVEIALPKPEAPPIVFSVSCPVNAEEWKCRTRHDGDSTMEPRACHCGSWIENGCLLLDLVDNSDHVLILQTVACHGSQ